MRLGVIARADDRGLGNQTWEVARHLDPARVLVVRVPGSERQGFEPHLERFPGATVVTVDDHAWFLPEREVREWLDGLDVVYTAETPYDWRVAEWADEQGVALVVHANAEFHKPRPEPVTWWVPTDWRLDHVEGARVVPMPCPIDRWPTITPGAPRRVIHVAGRPATGDRNGTKIVRKAMRHLDRSIEVEILEQGAHVDYWRAYEGASALLMPRRYGGLCLPVLEACGAGVVPIMPECVPNRAWPIRPLAHRTEPGVVNTPGGRLDLHEVTPGALAEAVHDLFSGDVEAERAEVRAWAEAHSWDALADEWRSALADAIEDRHRRPPRPHPGVSVVVPWRGGCPHRERAWEWVRARYAERYPSWQIILAEAPPGPWIKARAVAAGLERATGDVLVIADADVWTDTDLAPLVDEVRTSGRWAMPHDTVLRLAEDSTATAIETGRLDQPFAERPYRGTPGGGLVILTRAAYDEVPLDPRFVGWGQEDASWGMALREILGRQIRGNGDLWHLWHPPQERLDRHTGSRDGEHLRRQYTNACRRPGMMQALLEEAKAI